MRAYKGFSLIEIAIVLVIIGLLLGGVLKGREMLTISHVRNLIAHQDNLRTAYWSFIDRHRALPGDYSQAQANIPGCGGCQQGDNNGRVDGAAEPISAWEHLSKGGFITGSYVFSATAAPANTPVNPYGSLVQLIFDAVYQDPAPTARHNLKTGVKVPSDILSEVDRKIDDGLATGGQLRFSTFGGAVNTSQECFNTVTGAWQSATPNANCGATTLF